MEICPKCGLPIQACACGEIGKEEQKIKAETIKRKYRKIITHVSGFKNIDIKSIAKELKKELACGGTIRSNDIELQGQHNDKVKKILVEMGFEESSIQE